MRSIVTSLAEVAGMLAVSAGAGLRFGWWAGLICGGVCAVAAGISAA
jgi:hypothetical protein